MTRLMTLLAFAVTLFVGVTTAHAADKIVVDPNLDPRVPGAIRARAKVEIEAPPAVVRDQILNLQARVREGWLVDSVSIYRNDERDQRIHRRARWTLSILGIDIVYHCVYDWDPRTGNIVWWLDPAKANDLGHAEGVYRLRPGAHPGTTTLTYTVEVGSKHRAARGLKRRITTRNVAKLLESVRARSEARVHD